MGVVNHSVCMICLYWEYLNLCKLLLCTIADEGALTSGLAGDFNVYVQKIQIFYDWTLKKLKSHFQLY